MKTARDMAVRMGVTPEQRKVNRHRNALEKAIAIEAVESNSDSHFTIRADGIEMKQNESGPHTN